MFILSQDLQKRDRDLEAVEIQLIFYASSSREITKVRSYYEISLSMAIEETSRSRNAPTKKSLIQKIIPLNQELVMRDQSCVLSVRKVPSLSLYSRA